jgi:hypothetical protein
MARQNMKPPPLARIELRGAAPDKRDESRNLLKTHPWAYARAAPGKIIRHPMTGCRITPVAGAITVRALARVGCVTGTQTSASFEAGTEGSRLSISQNIAVHSRWTPPFCYGRLKRTIFLAGVDAAGRFGVLAASTLAQARPLMGL